MDWELIWWIGAAIACVGSVMAFFIKCEIDERNRIHKMFDRDCTTNFDWSE